MRHPILHIAIIALLLAIPTASHSHPLMQLIENVKILFLLLDFFISISLFQKKVLPLCLEYKMCMISQQTKDFIPEIQKCLRMQPVEKAWLFGSYSRGEETEGSDVDIMVRCDNKTPITLFTISKIMLDIKKVLGRDVDLVEEDQLLPFAQESANKNKLLIYERESLG